MSGTTLSPASDPALASAAPPNLGSEPRFEFGSNWRRFLDSLSEPQIVAAVDSLQQMLGVSTLAGQTFLDVGCGSGLFSLAAYRLGATVHSFDYDSQSVACAGVLRERERADESRWTIERGSALDEHYLAQLGKFDVVYSWGVLHHTGAMWRAIDLTAQRVAPGGQLWIALYNDQGRLSRIWWSLKRLYVALPTWFRPLYVALIGGAYYASKVCERIWQIVLDRSLALITPGPRPVSTSTQNLLVGVASPSSFVPSQQSRGMRLWTDLVDWVGGFPFETATPDQVVEVLRQERFELIRLKTCGGKLGCNEFLFQRREGSAPRCASAEA